MRTHRSTHDIHYYIYIRTYIRVQDPLDLIFVNVKVQTLLHQIDVEGRYPIQDKNYHNLISHSPDPRSPFNKRKWDEASNKCVRTNIVRQALRLAW
jgi:hypothetical protein